MPLSAGDVVDGYRFLGGSPNDQASWEPAGAAAAPAPVASSENVGASRQGRPEAGDVIDGYRFKGGDPSSKDNWEAAGGFGRAVLDAATFGLADEARAAGAAVGDWVGSKLNSNAPQRSFSESYDRALKNERAANASMSLAERLTGAVAGALVNAPRAVAGLISSAPRWANAVLEGAAYGAAYGAGSGEGVRGRIEGANTGAALGGAAGAVAPVLAAGARGATRALRPQARAEARVAESLRRSGVTPAAATARLQQLGPEATIADVGGENTTALARAVANLPGESRDRAVASIMTRQEARPDRVTSAIQRSFGAGEDWYPAFQRLDQQRRSAAAPLYKRAYQNQPGFSQELENILNTPAGRSAMQRARRIAGNEGVDFQSLFINVSPNGSSATVRRVPDMRGWDYIKRGLDDVVEKYRDSTTGRLRLDTEGRSVNDVRQRLIRELDAVNPDYAAARQEWAGPSRAMEAMEQGRLFAKRPSEITAERLRGMSPADRDYFRLGVARAMWEQAGSAPGANRMVRDAIGNRNFRRAIRAVSPDQLSYGEFMGEMQRLAQFGRTSNAVFSGSRTAHLEREMNDLDTGVLRDLAEAARGGVGGITGLIGRGASSVGNRMRAGASERTRDALGRLLFETDPATNARVLNGLGRTQALSAAPDIGLVPGAAVGANIVNGDDDAKMRLIEAVMAAQKG